MFKRGTRENIEARYRDGNQDFHEGGNMRGNDQHTYLKNI
jgi:hypothetical protein